MEHLAHAWKEPVMEVGLEHHHEADLGLSGTRGGVAVLETPMGVAIERAPHNKLHRIAVACVKCRRRRVKCDGDGIMPCGGCSRINKEADVCSYVPPPETSNRMRTM